ncbi:Mss4-like protein [Lipomyces chichibuensis]|uniref:Mss4-like protein n=1 Tax=Lipomyces chichibuensis TaxID=1546026 RepID=UPI0033440587
MPSYNGSCDCGAIQFDAEIDQPDGAILCHCDECKIRYGAFCPVYAITKGKEYLKSWAYKGDSGEPVPCTFCSNCGTNLYRQPKPYAGNKIVIAGTLKQAWNSEELRPTASVYNSKKLHWFTIDNFKNLDHE